MKDISPNKIKERKYNEVVQINDFTGTIMGRDATTIAKSVNTQGNSLTLKTSLNPTDDRLYIEANVLRTYNANDSDVKYRFEISGQYLNFYEWLTTNKKQSQLFSSDTYFAVRRYDDNEDVAETYFFTDNSFYANQTSATTLGTTSKKWTNVYATRVSPTLFVFTSTVNSSPAEGDFWYDGTDLQFKNSTAAYKMAMTSGNTGGTGSAGAGNQYIEITTGGNTFKVLHDGTI